ncbi:MAG: L,D-transpeptidase family protein [Hyphomicrobium sp.]|jgi:murein L,D-transpeptidase YcbB/YkuD
MLKYVRPLFHFAALSLAVGLCGFLTAQLASAEEQKADRAAEATPATKASADGAAKDETPAAKADVVKTDADKIGEAKPDATKPDAAEADEAKAASAKPASTAQQENGAKASDGSQIPSPSAAATIAAGEAKATDAVKAPVAAAPAVDPIVAAARVWIGGNAGAVKADKDDLAAATAFYADRSGAPLWLDKSGFNARAKAAMDELRKADDWGLEASAFALPALAEGAGTEALAEVEAKLTIELLKYARFAKGGRVVPTSLSRILDQVPPVKDPKQVLSELAAAAAPDAYLRGLHPKHEQFERLRQAMLKARGPSAPAAPVDEALKVKVPEGKALKEGVDHADVALLRKRLKVPAEAGAKDTLFDEKLVQAVKDYQAAKGLKATGQLTNATRGALNREGEPKVASDKGDDIRRLVLNMERWRWMPEQLGETYVWNNIPEFYTRVIKRNEEIFKEKIIVGMPEWATPVFSADMQFVTFNPTWGVPDGIKARELAPRLRSAGGGFLFFGGGGGGSIIRAYGFNVYRDGRQIDPDSVDWSNADLRAYSFQQPAGGKNPLGVVKFRFPNKHDVYMHDTIQRELFSESTRAMSHGCIRVQNPRQLAAVLLAEGNGLDAEATGRAIGEGGEIALKKPIPVHMTYFTVIVDKDGGVRTFADLYGHDSKLSQALLGRAIRSEGRIETSSVEAGDDPYPSEPTLGKKAQKRRKGVNDGPQDLSEAISGLFAN